MAERDEMISQFKDVTGVVDTERAQFYLESTAWQLDVAISSFFESVEDIADAQRPDIEEIPVTNNTIENSSRPVRTAEDMSSKSKSKSRSNFGTLRDLQNQESSSDEEEGQAFYAGGSTNSGQQVLGPGKKKDKDKQKKDIINDMFKSCQEQAVPMEENKHSNRPSTFKGTGYKLGMTSSDTEVIAPPQAERRPSTGVLTLKLWQNGFTINDREIRLYDDPANQEFLDTIKRGEIPQEIRQEIQGGEVGLNMEDHRHEEYVPPKPQVKAFSGKGQMLGSPSPAAAGLTIPVDPSDQAANEALAQNQLNVDKTQPITTIQIRLADGSNVRIQFNLTHTIEDIRRYITTMRPQYALREFILQTTYPTKELSEDKKTIQEANLQNSAIMQRLK